MRREAMSASRERATFIRDIPKLRVDEGLCESLGTLQKQMIETLFTLSSSKCCPYPHNRGRQQNQEHGTFRNIPEYLGTGQIVTK